MPPRTLQWQTPHGSLARPTDLASGRGSKLSTAGLEYNASFLWVSYSSSGNDRVAGSHYFRPQDTNCLSGCNLHQACLRPEACPDKGFRAIHGRNVATWKHSVHWLSAFWDLREAASAVSSRLWGIQTSRSSSWV